MNKKITKKPKYLYFILAIMLLGFIVGTLYYIFLSKELKTNITVTLTNFNYFRYNAIIKDLLATSSLFVCSFFIIGIPFSIFYLFYESFAFAFLISVFVANYHLGGLLYILIYFLINKLLTWFLLIMFIKKIFNISRYIIGTYIYKNELSIQDKLVINVKNSLYIIIFIGIINVVLYLITPFIFKPLSFLVK